jgi:translocation and assembly module TamB
LYAGWRFIHSSDFSNKASQKVSEVLTQKLGTNLIFKGVSFSLFPLATTFHNVKIVKTQKDSFDLNLSVEKLIITFTYSSFISSDFEIENLEAVNGSLGLKVIEDETEDSFDLNKIKTKEVYAKYLDVLNKIPIKFNIISLKNIDLNINQASLRVNFVSISPLKLTLRSKVSLANLKIDHQNENYPKNIFDSFQSTFELKKNTWNFDKMIVKRGRESLESSGSFFNERGGLNLKSKGHLEGSAGNVLVSFKKIPDDIKKINTEVKIEYWTEGVVDDPNVKANFLAERIETPWIVLEKARGTFLKKNNLLYLENITALNHQESYEIKKQASFFDLATGKFTDFTFDLKMKNAFTNTFLLSAKESLGQVKAFLSGRALVKLYSDRAEFVVVEKIALREFRLMDSFGKQEILKNDGFSIESGKIILDKDSVVTVDVKASMPNSRLNIKGKIDSKKIDVDIKDSTIDLKSFGPISGISIIGAGPVDLKVSGPIDDIIFNFNVDWQNFSVVDLNLGKIKSKFSFKLNDLELAFEELSGEFNKTHYEAFGKMGFSEKNNGMDLKINIDNSTFVDSRKMFNLVFKNLKIPSNPDFNFYGNYRVKGGFDLDSLTLEGEVKGTNFKMFDEEAEKVSMKFNLAKKMIHFKNIKLSKSRGEFNASANVNLGNNFIEVSGAASGLRLKDFNFYKRLNLEYDGDVVVDFDGNGMSNDFNSKFKVKVANAFIGNVPASSSSAVFYLNTDDIITNASLLAGKIKIDSLLSFSSGVAAVKANVETNDMKEFLGIFSAHNINDKTISGRVKAQLNTQISTGSLGVRKFYLGVDEFVISKGDLFFKIDPDKNKIEVDEGVVKNWDIRFKDGNEFLNIKGRNITNGKILIEHRFSLKTSLLELIFGQIEKTSGLINGNATASLDKEINVIDLNISGDKQSLKLRSIPGFITNLDYNIIKRGEGYDITRMLGKYGEGDFKINGKFLLNNLRPQVNLNYQIDRATIPLFKKSNVLISSSGNLVGADLPYKLSGKLSFMHGEILEDPADLMKENKVSIDEFRKYLPEDNTLSNKRIIELNIAFDFVNPILIKNNMTEIYAKGNGVATGDIMSPELNTRIETLPTVSKFKFKGHDFALSQGYVEIRDKGKNRISDLKFTGTTKINEYDMKLDLSGSIANINVDLSSEPALSKEDLLSLLTLGVTSDISKNLEAAERRFVTTVGIGSLLVDQLKINEDLNATLGVKLSVQPEFKEDETTLVQGKSAVSEGSNSKLKSATKIKINKQISNRVDVSLSSTVGGSLEQKQEMNINLNINKNFSLEGIYEVKPTEDENTNTPNSLGADLKWRKSF